MAKVSRLEKEGINKRKEDINVNDYKRDISEYDLSHEDAKSGDDLQGKSTGVSLGYLTPDENKSSVGYIFNDIDTRNGGNIVDQEKRKKSKTINKYGEGAEYGLNSVEISNDIKGQFRL